MKKILLSTLLTLLLTAWCASGVFAHCEVPCGIYDDQLRVASIYEDLTTIEKSMKQVADLSKGSPVNFNQVVRWITTKEDHAIKIQDVVSRYFLTQRIKFDAKDYDKKLAALHKILVYAMKCKQTIDVENVELARKAVQEFEKLYFGHSHE